MLPFQRLGASCVDPDEAARDERLTSLARASLWWTISNDDLMCAHWQYL